MISKTTRKPTEAERLREQVLHLAVDLEYAGRQGDSAYSARVNKKLDKLYNKLDTLHNVSEG
jgi:ABC-type phosphate transport system auxiliary subunit